ncbi:MAG TPA: heavy metal transport/detoxification protein [Flavisolibacter sp.]|nr:heavy metal transport/detoxification protein [Flavisolibacter sp.]
MNTLKFKTNIKCSGCIAQSTPYLNEAVGETNWEVDLQDPNKTLKVVTDDKVEPQIVIEALNKAGYKAENIQQPG